MSFWAGFACGIAATYALALAVLAYIMVKQDRAERAHEECLYHAACAASAPWTSSPEYPTVSFTCLTNIGEYVQGSDD